MDKDGVPLPDKDGQQNEAKQEKTAEVSKKIKNSGGKNGKKRKKNFWPLKVLIITLVLSFAFSLLAQVVLDGTGLAIAIVVVLVFVIASILFDIIGVATTSADIQPFLAMSARKVKGAKMAVKLVKNAEKVSSVCADIIGDICGIVSGACGAVIAVKVALSASGFGEILISVVVAALIAAVTVTGKALGKTIAVKKSNDVVFLVAKVLAVFSKNK